MRAIQYVKSVPRYLAARLVGPRWNGLYTSPFGCIRLADLQPPRLPGPEWVRVQPRLSGICGSDLATITAQGSPYFSPFTSCPFVLGHEVVGEVVELGGAVDTVRKGDRVVLQPPLHCFVRGVTPLCDACLAGRTPHCRNFMRGALAPGTQTGFCRDTGGGWGQSFVAHWRQLHRVPDTLADDEAVLIEPFSCCVHAVSGAPHTDASTVVVLGAGTIGILTVAAIRALGSRCRLIVVAKHPHQQQRVRALGADIVLGTRGLHDEMARALGAESYQPELGRPVFLGGAGVVFDCIGSERSIDDALRFTGAGGTVVLVGMPGVPRKVDWTAIWHKELIVRGAYTSDAAGFARAIQLLQGLDGGIRGLTGAKFRLDQYKQAIHCALDTGGTGVVKTAFAMD